MKTFAQKHTVMEMKRQVTDWEKMFVKYISNKAFVHIENSLLNDKKANNSIKVGRRFEETFY